jgi:hypothetical protein
MAAVLLRTVLSDRDLSGPIERRRAGASAGDPKRLALGRVGLGKLHVETRPRPLPGCRWVAFFRFSDSCISASHLLARARPTRQPKYLDRMRKDGMN